MKAALASYHNKVKKELGNLFMKRTPVQEETSQEEEERIKAEFFSRLSPSPTDHRRGGPGQYRRGKKVDVSRYLIL